MRSRVNPTSLEGGSEREPRRRVGFVSHPPTHRACARSPLPALTRWRDGASGTLRTQPPPCGEVEMPKAFRVGGFFTSLSRVPRSSPLVTRAAGRRRRPARRRNARWCRGNGARGGRARGSSRARGRSARRWRAALASSWSIGSGRGRSSGGQSSFATKRTSSGFGSGGGTRRTSGRSSGFMIASSFAAHGAAKREGSHGVWGWG